MAIGILIDVIFTNFPAVGFGCGRAVTQLSLRADFVTLVADHRLANVD
jgi:hypothetical protein